MADGATLVPWARGRYIAWDFTAIQTCAASYIHLSSSVPGGAAEHAADRKCNKYATLPASHEFVPIAVETLGPINRAGREFLVELGRRGAAVSGDPRETAYLFQSALSVLTQLLLEALSHHARGMSTAYSKLDNTLVI